MSGLMMLSTPLDYPRRLWKRSGSRSSHFTKIDKKQREARIDPIDLLTGPGYSLWPHAFDLRSLYTHFACVDSCSRLEDKCLVLTLASNKIGRKGAYYAE